MSEPLLEMRGIVKTFPGVRALDGVDLLVRPGEVHCLLGQNGAGKSTLIKVLAGAHRPDEGEIHWRGGPVSLSTPDTAIGLGISTIYQELDLVAGLTVAENIFLGHEMSRGGVLRRGQTRKAARALLARLGHQEIRVDERAVDGGRVVHRRHPPGHVAALKIGGGQGRLIAGDRDRVKPAPQQFPDDEAPRVARRAIDRDLAGTALPRIPLRVVSIFLRHPVLRHAAVSLLVRSSRTGRPAVPSESRPPKAGQAAQASRNSCNGALIHR